MNRNIITNILLIAVCVAWFVPFIGILVNGSHLVREPNPFILGMELITFLVIIGFALANILEEIRKE